MDSSLTLQYPAWYLIFCLLLGLAFALALYLKDTMFKDASTGQRKALYLLSVLRFFAVSALAFLLLSPFIKTRFTDIQKPYIVLLQDNSGSVMAKTSPEDSLKYVQGMQSLVEDLSTDYKVQTYTFAEDLQEGMNLSFDKKVTDISSALNQVADRFDNQNVGAVVLATDGIFNQGSNPLYGSSQLDIPVYTVALGDTTPNRDIVLDKVLHNEIAYLGDKTTMRVEFSSRNAKGAKTTLNVYKGKAGGTKVHSKTVTINKENFLYSEEIIVDVDKAGIQQFTVTLSPVEGEQSTGNNRQNIYIDVLDSRQKILILANSPHPDLSALKQSIETNRNYETTVSYIRKFSGNTKDYDLAILHGLPSKRKKAADVISGLEKAGTPIWYILTNQSDVSKVSELQEVVSISGSNNSINQVKPLVSGDFNLFTLDSGFSQVVEGFPPLQSPFGEYKLSPTAQALLKQQIGSIPTTHPLFALMQSGNKKSAVLSGEGIWRWKMHDFSQDQNHETFDELVSKAIQYLVVKNDKRQFRVNMAKNLFNENETIAFTAELYNDSYELINEPEANITVTDDEGKEYPFTFSKTGNAYALDAGFLPVGNYSYRAKTFFAGGEEQAAGQFSVTPLQLEGLQTTADHQLLFALAERYGGEMVAPGQVTGLAEKFRNKEEIKPVLYSSYKNESVINLKWLFFTILSFLALEWFFRKYFGGY